MVVSDGGFLFFSHEHHFCMHFTSLESHFSSCLHFVHFLW